MKEFRVLQGRKDEAEEGSEEEHGHRCKENFFLMRVKCEGKDLG